MNHHVPIFQHIGKSQTITNGICHLPISNSLSQLCEHDDICQLDGSLLGWIHWVGSIGLDPLSWIHWVGSIGLDPLGWIHWVGSIGLDPLSWLHWVGSFELGPLGWIHWVGSIGLDPLSWIHWVGSFDFHPLGWVHYEQVRGPATGESSSFRSLFCLQQLLN